jgi:hypothetical protein
MIIAHRSGGNTSGQHPEMSARSRAQQRAVGAAAGDVQRVVIEVAVQGDRALETQGLDDPGGEGGGRPMRRGRGRAGGGGRRGRTFQIRATNTQRAGEPAGCLAVGPARAGPIC